MRSKCHLRSCIIGLFQYLSNLKRFVDDRVELTGSNCRNTGLSYNHLQI
jgi:hypothetical protein